MTEKDAKKTVAQMKQFIREVTSSKAKSQRFLKKAGIYTESGNLRQAFKK